MTPCGRRALYCDGVVFALIARGVLHLKANNATRPNFEAHGLSAFRPDEDKPGTMSYYPVPPEVLENREELARWAAEAIAAGAVRPGGKGEGKPPVETSPLSEKR